MQPEQARAQGPLQLLDGLTSSESPLPAGFLEDLLSRMEALDLRNVVVPLSKAAPYCRNCPYLNVQLVVFHVHIITAQHMCMAPGTCGTLTAN